VDAAEAIVREVGSWDGVTQGPHRLGGVELRYGRRALGRVDGDRVELAFHPSIGAMLVETGRAEPLDRDRVTFRIRGEGDAAEAVELFRLAWERARIPR
jgi:hypothetical protein